MTVFGAISDFFNLADPLIRNVVLGTVLLAISSAMVGCFTFLRKRALVGDAVSHAVLPGICLAFMFQGTKDPFVLMIGAFVTGWLSLWLIDVITSKTKLHEDTVIGLILSVFFGIGTLLLSFIQQMDSLPDKTGLNHFLFGSAVAISNQDLYAFGGIAVLLIISVLILYKGFLVLSFDEAYTRTIGFPVKLLKLTLTTLTVLAVVVGIQAVGVVLMAAMLITPAATTRFWTPRLPLMILFSAILGALSGFFGAYGSYITNSPTGPWMVMVLSMAAVLSFLFAPKKGIISNLIRQRKYRAQIVEENILKAIYQLGEQHSKFYEEYTVDHLLDRRPMQPLKLTSGLSRLKKQGYLTNQSGQWTFSEQGKLRGQRLVKLHRLWELYLTTYLRIAPDHVHDDADTIEHIITPELEQRLEKLLEYPETDPHESVIPYKSNPNN